MLSWDLKTLRSYGLSQSRLASMRSCAGGHGDLSPQRTVMRTNKDSHAERMVTQPASYIWEFIVNQEQGRNGAG